MKHVSEIITEPWFNEKPWLVLGTGPSLNNFDWQKHEDKNICAIYCASDVVPSADLVFVPDENTFCEYAPGAKRVDLSESHDPSDHRYIVTRAFNHKYGTPKNVLFFEYDCDIKDHPNPFHEIPYNGTYHGGDGNRYFPFHTPWPCSCTAKAIMHFFGTAGVKTLYTCGIDGGSEISHRMPAGYIKGHQSVSKVFDGEVNDLLDTANKFGIELIRI